RVRDRGRPRDHPARPGASVAVHRPLPRAIADRDGSLASHATHVHLHNALASILQNPDIEG
ncbi:MAG: GntR family transcriptional regulator, partial [Microbacterium gubbeenense]